MKRSALVIATLLLVACREEQNPFGLIGANPSLQLGAPTSQANTWTPVSFSIFQSCAGEVIQISGRLHVISTTWNGTDVLRIRGHLNSNLAGVGLASGTRYRVQQVTNQAFELEWSTGVAESEDVHHFNVVSAGSTTNFYLTMNGVWHFDGDGGVTIEQRKWESVCR